MLQTDVAPESIRSDVGNAATEPQIRVSNIQTPRRSEMGKTMKAAVLRGVNDLRLEELPIPDPEAGEALIKIKVAGVCGTDVHMWAGTNFEGTFPFVPGHEWVGEVVELGPGVESLTVGDRVVGECFIPCHICAVCRDGSPSAFCPDHRYFGFTWETPGGMAEYHVSPEERLCKVPDNVSEEAAALVEPVSVAYHAIWGRGGGVAPHDRVGVIGTGPIGLLSLQIAKVAGAQVIAVEPQPFRQRMAKEMGADVVVDPSQEDVVARVMELTDGFGLTLIIECSGSKAGIAATVDQVAVDGRIVLTGQSMGLKIPIELGKTIWKHAQVIGSCDAPHFFPKTIAYLSRQLADVTKLVTHSFPLSKVHEAFELALKGTECGKVLVRMTEK
jgi:L-iditol 2-dehydrogenase